MTVNMTPIKTCFVALFVLTSISALKAQTAEQILTKHTEALGGKDKISQLNTLYMEATTEVMGNNSPTKVYIVNGKNYRNEADMMGQSMVQVVSDKSGWAIMPFGGSTDPATLPDEQFKESADQVFAIDPLINYAASGGKAELAGQEKLKDINAYKIKYTNKYGFETTYFIDPATWYIVQAVRQGNMMGQSVTITTTFSNFKKTDFGVVVPMTTNVDMGQFAFTTNVTKIEVNKAIDPKIFDMPGK